MAISSKRGTRAKKDAKSPATSSTVKALSPKKNSVGTPIPEATPEGGVTMEPPEYYKTAKGRIFIGIGGFPPPKEFYKPK